mgnify:CR=1 FL=1
MDQEERIEQKELEALRREYAQEELSENSVKPDPVDQFAVWFQQALSSGLLDPNAMSLATATRDGTPSVRIVLLKGFDPEGFRFFTNYESRKGRELSENPKAALCFFWAPLERQVRIEGTIAKLDKSESDNYFQQRPRLSQIGAWASSQSSRIISREQLVEKFKEAEERFSEKPIPTPEFWGGYTLKPTAIEFWQGRPGRLHDRLLYLRTPKGWEISRLSP